MDLELLHGDCHDLMHAIPDGSVHALICDPPYGRSKADWDRPLDWACFWIAAYRICIPTAPMVFFAAQPFATDLINSNRGAFRYDLIWHKPTASGFLNAFRQPMRAHELILVFQRRVKGGTYHPQRTYGHTPYYSAGGVAGTSSLYSAHTTFRVNARDGRRAPRSVLTYDRTTDERKSHSTAKPVALMRWLVETYTNPGDLVLDPCMGSGATGLACQQTGRQFIGIEQDETFYRRALARLTLQEALL